MSEGTEEGAEPGHDPAGTELAQRIAGAYASIRPRRRRRRTGRAKAIESAGQDREPTPVGDVLGRLVQAQGWETELSVHRVLNSWSALVGPEIAAHTEPVDFSEGQVTVQSDSTAWATQLRLLAPTIVAKLNAALGEGTVRRIEVRGPHAPSWKKGRRSAPGRGPRDTYG